MTELWNDIVSLFSEEGLLSILRGILVLVPGLVATSLLSRGVGRLLRRRSNAQLSLVARRVTYFFLLAITVVGSFHAWGVDLGVLLGAAGILTIALGFASQTSASNIISGFFLIGERPFVIGDIVRVGDKVGEVISIDMMSVKLRTFDNLLVRVPNETLLKSEITTLTYFPIRRVDLLVGVAYKEDLEHVREVLMGVAKGLPLCLDEPEPLFIFEGYGDSALQIKFSVWAARENFLDVRTAMYLAVKRAFDEADIEIPFPHLSLYAGSVTRPFPIRATGKRDEAGEI